MRSIVVILGIVAALGCSKKEGEGEAVATDDTQEADKAAAKPSGLDNDFLVGQVQKEIGRIKEGLAAGKDPYTTCAAGGTYVEKLPEGVGTAEKEEFEKLCAYDVPMAQAKKAVEEAEEARAAEPDKKVLSKCFNAKWKTSTKQLDETHPDDADYQSLKERWNKVCPPKE